MNMHSFGRGTDAHSDDAETEALAQQGFTREETATLLRLQAWYQYGRSDLVNVIRHLEFLKFLVRIGKLDS